MENHNNEYNNILSESQRHDMWFSISSFVKLRSKHEENGSARLNCKTI